MATPATPTGRIDIEAMERRADHRPGFYARIHSIPQDYTLHLSKLDSDDAGWVVDGMFGPGSFPHWMHGYGSRITRLRVIDDATLVARLDEAAEAAR